MAIECRRCGGPTMRETVIQLRRGILGLRETRWQGGYCAVCKVSVPMDSPATVRPAIAVGRRPSPGLGGSLAMWLRGVPARSGGHVC